MIYLVRQGQTDWNLEKKFNGETETYLNETGIREAKELAQKLSGIEMDCCFCSSLKRAVQTAGIIAKGKMILDDRLKEIRCGEFEGTYESKERMKLFWEAVMSGTRGVECFEEFMKRNLEFCDMVKEEQKGKNILIVTHAANARVIDYYFSGKPKDYDFQKAVARCGEILKFEN